MKNIKKIPNKNWGKGKSSWNKNIPRSTATKNKISASMQGKQSASYGKKGEEAHNWKGNKAGISAKHKWVEQNKGLAKNHLCAHCRKVRARDWANVNHSYLRRLDDYAALCVKCHRAWDKMMKLTTDNRMKQAIMETFGSAPIDRASLIKLMRLQYPNTNSSTSTSSSYTSSTIIEK